MNLNSHCKSIGLICVMWVGFECSWAPAQVPRVESKRLHTIDTATPEAMRELFRYTGELLPLVSAHRGGPGVGFPENCIATFEHTLQHTYAMLEIDPRMTSDGAVVVIHDATLERTTTGQGLVAEHSLEQLKQLRLKDADGNVTDFQIPTLDEVLEWARGKTILVLDQKDVPLEARIQKIEEHHAEAYTMLIVANLKDALTSQAKNKNIMMELFLGDREKWKTFEQSGIPASNVIAFVGHTPPTDKELFQSIHAKGTMCMLGTSRNLDKEYASQRSRGISVWEKEYLELLKFGADIIETDIPRELGGMLNHTTIEETSKAARRPISTSKSEFFR